MSRLAFQSQLASIMEVLANAAVAEICKLVEDEQAVVSLQVSQCQRENKGLKRKLSLLELRMARGYAERRLREAGHLNHHHGGGSSGGRPRVHISTGAGVAGGGGGASQQHNPGVVFDRQMDLGLWPGGSSGNNNNNNTNNMHAVSLQDESPDVQLVEPEPLMVKEEKVERGEELVEMEDIALIGEDGVVECHRGGVRGGSVQQENQSSSCQTQNTGHLPSAQRTPRPPGPPGGSRGVEVSGSSPLLKPDVDASVPGRDSLLHTPPPPLGHHHHHHHAADRHHHHHAHDDHHSHTTAFEAFCDATESASALVGEFFGSSSGMVGDGGAAAADGRRPSCSYSAAAVDAVNGWPPGGGVGGLSAADASSAAAFSSLSAAERSKALHRTSGRERLFVCSYCGKAFNRPKKVEIHQRIHTGERPFRCSTCGKTFSEAGNMKKHQRVHTGEKPYSCELCGKGFAWIRNLKTHQLKSHPEVYTEEVSWTHAASALSS